MPPDGVRTGVLLRSARGAAGTVLGGTPAFFSKAPPAADCDDLANGDFGWATEMIPLPAPVVESGLDLLLTNLWIGKGGTTAVLHYDDYENLLCQIRGTKELILFPPNDLENLYYVGRRKGKLKYTYPGGWRRDELDGSNKVIFSSSVRLDDPDFGRHPRLRRCRPYRVVLEEGDVLYMPAYWHHEVRSYPDEEEGNVAVNFWFRNVTSFAEVEKDVLGLGNTADDVPDLAGEL